MGEYLSKLPDGTVKQRNPFGGTRVWTVSGRGNRPLAVVKKEPKPLQQGDREHACVFCSGQYLKTPPEKDRLIRSAEGWEYRQAVLPKDYYLPVAEFRRIPNLFEILSYDYWHLNYGYELSADILERKRAYLDDPQGRNHVLYVVKNKLKAMGVDPDSKTQAELLELSSAFFASGHDVIVPRRHYTDDAVDTAGLSFSGSLTPDEHEQFIRFTIDAARDLYADNRYARYVAVFQNWLQPAGASIEHLHKQLVAIDDWGGRQSASIKKLRKNPNVFNEDGTNYASMKNLFIAENDYALAFAGFGHRYPTIEIYSKSEASFPWEHEAQEVRAMSDLIHAMHAATGVEIPTNEEWHYRPIDFNLPMPWRVMLKWRISTLAGFEGDTKIYLNTIDPWTLRDRVVPRLYELRDSGAIAPIRIATECAAKPNSLRYRW
ncbi:MAG: DUF4921 family protein [Propionibacteriaceae bacterium]|nr:DUF4921 family protein [Propionibacteriaceae bacterium]